VEKIPVLIDPMPSRALVGNDPEHTPPDTLGLFSGSSLAERSEGDFELPPTIHVFQRNVERSCSDRKELVEQLRITLYHELGHYFGFDEEGRAELGLE
jgi:predicted Zn-dependent protease with MMP-like domain